MARIGIDIRKIRDFGIGTYLRNLVDGCARADAADEFLLLHKPDDAATDCAPSLPRFAEPSRLYSLNEPFSLGKSSRRLRLDLLHCPHYVTPFRCGCPFVVTIHDLIHLLFPEYLPGLPARAYAHYFLSRAAKKAALIFTVSEGSKRDILEHLPAREEQVIVTHDAVDPLFLQPLDDETVAATRRRLEITRPYVLCVGNNKPHKNLGAALSAFAAFRRRAGSEWLLVFAGGSFSDPHAGATLLRQVEESGLADAVTFLGYLGDDELHAVYTGAGIFLFPSLYEGFGLPPLEAMACGTPVVSSDRSVMPEILGDAALLIDPTDHALLADALERVAGDASLRNSLIEKGKIRAHSFTWEKTVQETLAGYRRALEAA